MLELHHRISSDHSFERSHLGQIGDQNFRHAVDQVFLLRISRKIHQRQNQKRAAPTIRATITTVSRMSFFNEIQRGGTRRSRSPESIISSATLTSAALW